MLTEPIVEGAYYEREDGAIMGPFRPAACGPWRNGEWFDGRRIYRSDGTHYEGRPGERLTRRVYIVPTDPAEVVAELRELADKISQARHPHDDLGRGQEGAFDAAADLVAEKLGVES